MSTTRTRIDSQMACIRPTMGAAGDSGAAGARPANGSFSRTS
jgi:hypothetical protein